MLNPRHLTFVCILLAGGPVHAQTGSGTEIAAIRAEIARLTERLDRLEQAQGAPAPVAIAAAPAVTVASAAGEARAPALGLSGDLRYRHESIDEDGVAERHRHRIRARLALTADVTDRIDVGLGLASGDDDPVSANQTLDGGFDRNPLGIDRAFFTWRTTDELSFTGGKMANPFYRPGNHHLIFDGDLNPEGLALRYTGEGWFASYAGLWVEERAEADDSILLGGQVGLRRTLGGGPRLTAGVGYFDYRATQGQAPFFDGAPGGNRVDAAGNYVEDFNEAQLFAQLDLTARGRPLTVFADLVRNTEAGDADGGYAVGASFGAVSKPGSWRLGYAYQDLEADAVIGAFTDSDFGGGGTDSRGHVIDFTYALHERWLLGVRYFSNERGADAGDEHDYNRLQADVMFVY